MVLTLISFIKISDFSEKFRISTTTNTDLFVKVQKEFRKLEKFIFYNSKPFNILFSTTSR